MTQKENEMELKKEYQQRYKDWCEIHSAPLDWSNPLQKKYCAVYDYNDMSVEVYCYADLKHQGTIYVSNPRIINDFIASITEDVFRRYVLDIDDSQCKLSRPVPPFDEDENDLPI